MTIWGWLYEASGSASYYAHAVCLTNDPIIMALYVFGDLATWLSYMVIGVSLWLRRGQPLLFSQSALLLYGAFIFLCGMSHLSKTVTLFVGAYRFDVLIIAAMATVSLLTAVVTVTHRKTR